jgi:hypothetical protein
VQMENKTSLKNMIMVCRVPQNGASAFVTSQD